MINILKLILCVQRRKHNLWNWVWYLKTTFLEKSWTTKHICTIILVYIVNHAKDLCLGPSWVENSTNLENNLLKKLQYVHTIFLCKYLNRVSILNCLTVSILDVVNFNIGIKKFNCLSAQNILFTFQNLISSSPELILIKFCLSSDCHYVRLFVNFHTFNIFSRTNMPISTKLDTKHF